MNIKRIVLALMLITVTSGCIERVYQSSIEEANEICANNGGVKYIDANGVVAPPSVRCNNSALFYLPLEKNK